MDGGRRSVTDAREALRLLGDDEPPAHRGAAQRRLREWLASPGEVRRLLDDAPDGAREVFVTLVREGSATVEALLGRGWWGRGALPPPLDWLQRRGLVDADLDGLVRAESAAVDGFLAQTLDLPAAEDGGSGLGQARVEAARSVVVAEAGELDPLLAVAGTDLRLVAPTVAVSSRPPDEVAALLRRAGVGLADDASVAVTPGSPALATTSEDAVGPRAIREILARAVAEERQVQLEYFASSRGGAATERAVDPWRFADDLLVGHCHLRGGERTFALDRIGRARLLVNPIVHSAPAD
ncbi:WYL domain-containing protein [Egibacter rhizosphaerae]|uniref:WYL domain-containing protein n=1 Tax=Egibacter rhizosphaerae TaxID=1670831 RepID=A0A411YCV3_9ACTN|nr:WYL domain-containing protein [Egibacter rhizosphaerae]QBI18977.1 WYL domain-containing protein [Egibacter rhizosphaerae]